MYTYAHTAAHTASIYKIVPPRLHAVTLAAKMRQHETGAGLPKKMQKISIILTAILVSYAVYKSAYFMEKKVIAKLLGVTVFVILVDMAKKMWYH